MSEKPAWYEIIFAKRGALRFLSHLELAAAFEKAIRRSRLPILVSRGYHPKPRISFAQALPVGAESEVQIALVATEEELPEAEVEKALASSLPEGLAVRRVRHVEAKERSALLDLTWETWLVEMSLPLSSAQFQAKLAQFLQKNAIFVSKWAKKARKMVDARPLIRELEGWMESDGRATLKISLWKGRELEVRATEVAEALAEYLGGGEILRSKQIDVGRRLEER